MLSMLNGNLITNDNSYVDSGFGYGLTINYLTMANSPSMLNYGSTMAIGNISGTFTLSIGGWSNINIIGSVGGALPATGSTITAPALTIGIPTIAEGLPLNSTMPFVLPGTGNLIWSGGVVSLSGTNNTAGETGVYTINSGTLSIMPRRISRPAIRRARLSSMAACCR